MTERQTATVETLTASVRVLMVGSRQVTLSIYKQLDECDAGRLKPFGRVNIDKFDSLDLVGVDRNGNLVRSRVPDYKDAIEGFLQREGWSPPYTDAYWERRAEIGTYYKDKYFEFKALPLIVLAGLR
jgi:hypothetical protein